MKSMEIIENADKIDLNQLVPYLKEIQPHKYGKDQEILDILKTLVNSERIKMLVAKENSTILGFAIFEYMYSEWYNGNYIYVHILYTRSESRKKGIGKLLVDKMKEQGKEKSIIGIQLDSGFDRTEAHMFYEKIGMKKVGFLFSGKI
jgi:GNAT superfamily N-acetyltransferase